jgi:hypothetical protein
MGRRGWGDTFSSCWKELGCCDLSMMLERWEGTPERGLGKRKEPGETRDEGRAAGSLRLSMLMRKEPRAQWGVRGLARRLWHPGASTAALFYKSALRMRLFYRDYYPIFGLCIYFI